MLTAVKQAITKIFALQKALNVSTVVALKNLAAVCPMRKDLIKSRGKTVRDRSRSRSMARMSFANTVTNNTPNNNIPNIKFQQQHQQQTFTPPSNLDTKNTQDLVAKIITSIVFAHYSEAQIPGTFQKTVDAMVLANGLPKVNFPQEIVTKEFEKLLHQSKDNIIEGISTPTKNVVEEIITVSENIVQHNIRTTNVMETEQTDHGFKHALESSPEAPKKKREMATTSMATSSWQYCNARGAQNASSQTLQPLSLSLSPSPPTRSPHRESN